MAEPSLNRRERLIIAARDLLQERGDATFRMDDVAARAQTTKATLYRHFPSKAALLAAIVPAGTVVNDPPGRRQQILAAAARVIPQQGLGGATMEAIADEAGLSPAALYWYFTSKDELFLAVVDHLTTAIDLPTILGQEAVDDPERLLGEVATRGIAAWGGGSQLLGVLLAEAATRPALAEALYDRVVGPLWTALARYLAQQADQGAFRPGHPTLRVLALTGMLAFYHIARRAFGPRLEVPEPAAAARELADLFLRGVTSEGGGSP